MITAAGFLILMIPCIVTDIRDRTLPVLYILLFSAAAVICNLIFGWTGVWDMLFGALTGLLFILLPLLSRKGPGAGDGFLILGVGVFSGFGFTVPLLFGAFLLTALLGGGWLFFTGRSLKTRLPLAPFMGAAGLMEIAAVILIRGDIHALP